MQITGATPDHINYHLWAKSWELMLLKSNVQYKERTSVVTVPVLEHTEQLAKQMSSEFLTKERKRSKQTSLNKGEADPATPVNAKCFSVCPLLPVPARQLGLLIST